MHHLSSFALWALSIAAVSALETPLPGENFPDPNIIFHEGYWYSFATATVESDHHFQVASSPDFNTWTYLDIDPMPDLPSWVNPTQHGLWAPDVTQLDDGSFVMYWAANVGNTTSHAVSAATSWSITGPYTPIEGMLVHPSDSHGAFDAAGFKDWAIKGDWKLPVGSWCSRSECDATVNGFCGNSFLDPQWSEGGYGGTRYIVYKVQNADESEPGTRTPLLLQQVENDGITLVGEPVQLLTDTAGDYGSVEGPSLYKSPDATYVLTYSKGDTTTSKYTVSYATSRVLLSAFTPQENLLQTGDDGLNGPGGADMCFDGRHMVFHAIEVPVGTAYNKIRNFYAAYIDINDWTGAMSIVGFA